VFDSHEPHAEQLVGLFPALAPLLPLFRSFEGFLARRADALMTVTPWMVERFRAMGVDRTFYLPNVPRLPAGAVGLPRHWSRPPGAHFVIGRLGTITPRWSGVEPLLALGDELRRRGLPVRLVLAGRVMRGWEGQFQQLVRDRLDFVDYLGIIPVSEVAAIISECDLVASLRERGAANSECGFSTKIFDAMAAGVAVLSSRIPEDDMLVASTSCGILVDNPRETSRCADLVMHLAGDRDGLLQLGRNGRRAVEERYNWERYEPEFLSLIAGERDGRDAS
jgi:glycosyltransferase involved in cell wall biosynthesis